MYTVGQIMVDIAIGFCVTLRFDLQSTLWLAAGVSVPATVAQPVYCELVYS